ncbi:SpoIIE family protein phosphatase [Micromonospora sp. NPDC048830]|uniref:ATP-binding SpoIIE family protein phosphatase n=1 Tax=Micromonospora sp. NPDC048830 TaxID=3364257 RepID=UPI003722C874
MSSAQGGEDGGKPSGGMVQAELPALLSAAFEAGGEMGGRLRGFDWSATPLGPPSEWSAALVHAVGTMLSSRAQIVMFWGPEHRAFYNDAYRPTIGAKHPHALGQPAREHWVETWDVLGPLLESVRATGEAYRGEDHPFVLDRHGFLEDVYFDISYDPIREADGSINGVFCIVNETTGRVLGERRLRALADAAVAVNTARSTAEVLQVAARHALGLTEAVRVVVTAAGARYEADGGGTAAVEPSVVLPLTGTTGEQLGELRVWADDEGDVDPGRAALAQFARLIGVRLENARLYEAEHRIASTLQHSLLPRSLPQLPGAVVASRYLPSSTDVEVGGDWYDVIRPDGELVLVIGDVVGKGVRAAAAMGQLRNALRAYVLEGYDPGEALTRLNRLVCSVEQLSFATVVCLRFDPGTGRLRYASAGHPSPLLIKGGDVTLLHDRALGPPVGAIPATTYRTVADTLTTGTRLLLYTDGLIEDRQLGIDAALGQLREDATQPGEHVSDLIDAVVARVAVRPRRDDVAVLALEATEPHRFSLRLPADPTRLSVLRKRLEDFLVAHRVGATDVFDLTVAVSEAAANAIEHPVEPAEPTIGVEVTVADGEVVATVRDSGRWREPTGAGFRGRGLALIRALGELTVSRSAEGTEVTLRRRLQD